MLDSRKREIRIKADYFRANCKIGRYGIINLFKECERMGYKLVRYPLGENADLGFIMKTHLLIWRFKIFRNVDYRQWILPELCLSLMLVLIWH